MNVQDIVASDIAFAAVAHPGQTQFHLWLRFILTTRDTVSDSAATLLAKRDPTGIQLGFDPWLGLDVDLERLGEPQSIVDSGGNAIVSCYAFLTSYAIGQIRPYRKRL